MENYEHENNEHGTVCYDHPYLDSLDFVPKTQEIYSVGFRQEKLIKSGKLSLEDYFEIGQKLAKIHMLKIDGLKSPNRCSRNTDQIYNHLKMRTIEWVVRCAFYDGNRSLRYHEILNRLKNIDKIIKAKVFYFDLKFLSSLTFELLLNLLKLERKIISKIIKYYTKKNISNLPSTIRNQLLDT